jgi:hypothetical protein
MLASRSYCTDVVVPPLMLMPNHTFCVRIIERGQAASVNWTCSCNSCVPISPACVFTGHHNQLQLCKGAKACQSINYLGPKARTCLQVPGLIGAGDVVHLGCSSMDPAIQDGIPLPFLNPELDIEPQRSCRPAAFCARTAFVGHPLVPCLTLFAVCLHRIACVIPRCWHVALY